MALAMTVGAVQFGGFGLKTVKADPAIIRINCGAGHGGEAGTGGGWCNQAIAVVKNIVPGWLPDDDFINESSLSGEFGGSNSVYYAPNLVTDLTAADAAPQGVYDSVIQVADSPLEYIVPVGEQGDEYTVKLHFGWTALTSKNDGEGSHRNTVVYVTGGASVAVNGNDGDVFDKTAIVRTTTATADENGNITIDIRKDDGGDWGAIINGIELIPGVDPVETPDPEATPTPEATPAATSAPTPTPAASSVPNQTFKINCGAGHGGELGAGGGWRDQATAVVKNIVPGWLPDDDFIDLSSMSGSHGGKNTVYYIPNVVTDISVANAAPQGVYDSVIQIADSNLRYIVPAGGQGDEYTVRLHFGWTALDANGSEGAHRNAVVYVTGGAPVVLKGSDSDVFDKKAIIRETTAAVDPQGNITIEIVKGDGADWGAMINGIELIPGIDPVATPDPETTPTPEATPAPTPTPAASPMPNQPIRINFGAGHSGETGGGAGGGWRDQATAAVKNIVPGWLPDDDFIDLNSLSGEFGGKNTVYYVPGVVIDISAENAAPQGVYDSVIQVANSNLIYVVPVGSQGDKYDIRLHFGWTALDANGSEGAHRNAVVYVTGGAPVVLNGTDADVFDKKAIIRETTAAADPNGNITIEIAKGDGADWGAMINGIELIPSTGKIVDINGDGQVDSNDLAILLDDYGKTGAFDSDLEPDGQVDSADLSLLLDNYGK